MESDIKTINYLANLKKQVYQELNSDEIVDFFTRCDNFNDILKKNQDYKKSYENIKKKYFFLILIIGLVFYLSVGYYQSKITLIKKEYDLRLVDELKKYTEKAESDYKTKLHNEIFKNTENSKKEYDVIYNDEIKKYTEKIENDYKAKLNDEIKKYTEKAESDYKIKLNYEIFKNKENVKNMSKKESIFKLLNYEIDVFCIGICITIYFIIMNIFFFECNGKFVLDLLYTTFVIYWNINYVTN